MARIKRDVGLDEVERCRANLDDSEMAQFFRAIERQYLGQKRRGRRAVARADDSMVEGDGWSVILCYPFESSFSNLCIAIG